MSLSRFFLAGTWGILFSSCQEPTQHDRKAEAPNLATESVTDRGTAASLTFEVLNQSGQCVLRTGGKDHALVPKAPCYFVRAPGKAPPWSFEYSAVKTAATLIVVGSPASESTRKTWNLSPGAVCGEQAQGVLVRGGAVIVTKNVREGGVYCRDSGMDEKEFYTFAHEEK